MDEWDLDIPLMATDLQVQGCCHRVPVVYGDNLRVLDIYLLEHHDAPLLPSLLSLTPQNVKVAGKVLFVPGEWCPHLEELRLENPLLDIRLPLLKLLVMETSTCSRETASSVYVSCVSCAGSCRPFHDGEDEHRRGRRHQRDNTGAEAHLRPHIVATRLISGMIT
uniref:Uncharacterized protein n=1 Tax=Leersia perrieri TaxID=77586 RepID=A0A0D9WX89_9ORYZ